MSKSGLYFVTRKKWLVEPFHVYLVSVLCFGMGKKKVELFDANLVRILVRKNG